MVSYLPGTQASTQTHARLRGGWSRRIDLNGLPGFMPQQPWLAIQSPLTLINPQEIQRDTAQLPQKRPQYPPLRLAFGRCLDPRCTGFCGFLGAASSQMGNPGRTKTGVSAVDPREGSEWGSPSPHSRLLNFRFAHSVCSVAKLAFNPAVFILLTQHCPGSRPNPVTSNCAVEKVSLIVRCFPAPPYSNPLGVTLTWTALNRTQFNIYKQPS